MSSKKRKQLTIARLMSAIASLGERNGSIVSSIYRFLSRDKDSRPTRSEIRKVMDKACKAGRIKASDSSPRNKKCEVYFKLIPERLLGSTGKGRKSSRGQKRRRQRRRVCRKHGRHRRQRKNSTSKSRKSKMGGKGRKKRN
ncbi:uncharacterized protein LOC112574391 [Pomacea canaliculata]|uniref:uncharacterized protein LOC112574391 n=1 Tax=Pomacea canaliculata TaxID=400727 RepID=UPI000D732AF7|nr:uncharacterized protein LOC112574391 [Pomacea canaliculata]